MVNSKEFGKRLEKILDYYELSATAFSEMIDFNRSTISHLLSGRNKPSLEFVMKVLQQFPEVELYWLLNGKGIFPSQKYPSITKTTESQDPIMPPASQKTPKHSTETPDSGKQIEKVIIFFKDGTFKSYKQ